ncbi:MAG: T9SS type A sorting domain-containing protein [Candidatus Aegiribacteria sp.]|nr:T9SS type A sorting domain-containing protein [Candidatus Aegiribacteria sp.]
MIQLLLILLSQPCFSSVIPSDGAQTVIFTGETSTGYLALGSLFPSWGGSAHLIIYTLNETGIVTSSGSASFKGEPVCAAQLPEGAAVVCIDRENGISRLSLIDASGSEQWVTDFAGGFNANASVRSSGTDILLAGNDVLTPLIPRVALLSEQGDIQWNYQYTESLFEVRDVSCYNDQIFVLGCSEQPGWQSDINLMVTDGSGCNPQYFSISSVDGRFSPEAIQVDSRGIFLLVNTLTGSNGMVYDGQLIKLNFSMEIQWTGTVSGSSWIRGVEMISLADGGFALCGWTNSLPFSESDRSDLMLCKFNENGELLWNVNHGTLSTDYGFCLTGVSDGGFAVSGCVTEDLYQGWVLKTDSLGNVEPQGIEYTENVAFSIHQLSNPITDGNLSFLVNTPDSGMLEIRIYDMAGRQVTMMHTSVAQGVSTINQAISLPSGIYTVRVTDGLTDSIFRSVVLGGSR